MSRFESGSPARVDSGRSGRLLVPPGSRALVLSDCDHGWVDDRWHELRQLLNEWDFIGVFDPETNTDEYDCMIPPLLHLLASGKDPDVIQQFLDAELAKHFGMSVDRAEINDVAERLTAWWRASCG